MSDNTADAPGRDVSRAAGVLPIIEGALAALVITFIAQVWHAIPPEHGKDAFVLIYASGAHFIFSFLLVAPGIVICRQVNSLAINVAFLVGLFAYLFWSLNEQHSALANLLITPAWQIPLPLAPELSSLLRMVLGGEANSLFIGPLVLGWVALGVTATILAPLLSITSKKKG